MARFDDDDDLMAELSAAVAEERLIPPGAFEDARAAFLLRGVDEELELLTILYDSLLDQESLVRGAEHASVRTLPSAEASSAWTSRWQRTSSSAR